MILDTKLVPDFFLHACCFFITGNRPVLKPPLSESKGLTHEHQAPKSKFVSDPESEIFFLIDSETLKLGRFIYFIYCPNTKVDILLNF